MIDEGKKKLKKYKNIKWKVGFAENLNIPNKFALKGSYPNPFNPITTISYEIAKLSDVKISIYNTKGQLVKVLSDKLHEPGTYDLIWNAQGYFN